jgi:hypothetical protein
MTELIPSISIQSHMSNQAGLKEQSINLTLKPELLASQLCSLLIQMPPFLSSFISSVSVLSPGEFKKSRWSSLIFFLQASGFCHHYSVIINASVGNYANSPHII